MTRSEKIKSNTLTFWLYLCGFLLLWEWLRPLKQLTDTQNIGVFIGFIVVSLGLSYVQVPILARVGIRLLYLLYTINFLYYEGTFFRFKWIGFLSKDVIENMKVVFEGDWTSLTDSFRTLLFFLLLALITYLLKYWLVQRKQIFIFFFMTLIYITVLDTFTPFDATYTIVRIIIIGFALMGILTFYRIMDREKWKKQPGFLQKWLTPLVVMVCVSVLIGYAAPKASPIWPDPVPYITSLNEESGSDGPGGLNKVGYGVDDSNLGGPFLWDDTVVYEAEVDTRQYWKVETKDVYTGRGWISSVKNGERIPFTSEDTFPITNIVNPNVEVDERKGRIKPMVEYQHLIYPLGLTSVKNELGHRYEVDESLEKIYVMYNNTAAGIDEYEVEYSTPRFSLKAMTSTIDSNHPLLTDEFLTQYTQLPETLPQRVKDLAAEITKDKNNWYDKAKAVESYFDRVEFEYNQKDVATPGRNDDYVDQFLFETQKGYCDNFSSSMVVLMRSLGIPTRWVKGYTEGTNQGNSESGQRTYVITNNNAHSWVEVFFPEVGWVPFEPTKGYFNAAQFSYDIDSSNTNTSVTKTPEKPEVEKPQEQEKTSVATKTDFSWKKLWEDTKEFLNLHWGVILGISLGIVVIGYVLYETRIKWLPHYLVFQFKWRKKDEDFPAAYFALLNQLSRYGLKRGPAQTLRDYADYIDEYFSSKEMGTLTANYERYVYKGRLEEGSWEKTRELWENLIKKTTS